MPLNATKSYHIKKNNKKNWHVLNWSPWWYLLHAVLDFTKEAGVPLFGVSKETEYSSEYGSGHPMTTAHPPTTAEDEEDESGGGGWWPWKRSAGRSKFECAHLREYWPATYMSSDALTQTTCLETKSTIGITILNTSFAFRVFALVSLVPLCAYVSIEQAIGTSEETMVTRLVSNGRPQ